MALNLPQQAVSDSDKRFRVLIGGRRLGKTFLAIRELARFARVPDRKVMYIAPSYRMAKQLVWKELKQKLIAINWLAKANESELTVTLVNGSVIMLRSADNYDSIRGLGVDFVVFDEFADIAKETWTEVVRPALSDRGGHALFIGTPKGVGNWSKELFDRAPLHDDWESWQFTTLEGGNVSASEIESAKSDLDARTFRQEYMASFETYSNAIYYNFGNSRIAETIPVITRKDILHVGMDFNVNPMAAVIGLWDGDKISIIDNIEIYGSNTQEMCDEIKERYPNNRIWAYPDASGGAGSTKGTSDHKILQLNGFTVKSPRKNPPVKDRINAVNAAFENAQGINRLSVHWMCKKLIECLEKHSYKADTRQPDKNSGYDHHTDALGYLVHSLMPITTYTVKDDRTDYFGVH